MFGIVVLRHGVDRFNFNLTGALIACDADKITLNDIVIKT